MKKSSCFFDRFTPKLDIFQLGFKQYFERETSLSSGIKRGRRTTWAYGKRWTCGKFNLTEISQFFNLNRV